MTIKTLFIRPEAAVKNLACYLHCLKTLPCCMSLDLNGKAFAVCTHVDSAFENWVYCPDGNKITPDDIRRTLDFFNKENVPFVWPILNHNCENLILKLEEAGLHQVRRLVAMNWNAGSAYWRRHEHANTWEIVKAISCAEVERWADAAWKNFGGEIPAPDSFRAFAASMSKHPDMTLVMLNNKSEDVGTFLLVNSGSETGVYYFAVSPDSRRKGYAMDMMNSIGHFARETFCPLVTLQATPMGVPFYDAAGFVACGVIPIYSNSDDVS